MGKWMAGVWLALAACAGCGGEQEKAGKAAGAEGGPCYGNDSCNDGLTCASETCVRLPGAGGTSGAGGRQAMGAGGDRADSGVMGAGGAPALTDGGPEGGLLPDAGPSCDANAPPDCLVTRPRRCLGLDSGYEGDELCIEPPESSVGFQIHVGPDDYDDPDQVAPFVVGPGEETHWTGDLRSPNEAPVFVRGFHSRMRPTSTSFRLFDGAAPLLGDRAGVFLAGAHLPARDADTWSPDPEDQGLGAPVAAEAPIRAVLHSLNSSDEARLAELWVNFILIPEEEVVQFLHPISWFGGVGMSIPPDARVVLSNGGASCSAPRDLRIVDLGGDMHANGERIASIMRGASGDQAMFADFDWSALPFWRFSAAVTNPVPEPLSRRGGAHSGLLLVPSGAEFVWECEIHNTRDVDLVYSNSIYDGEMCNVFGRYASPVRDSAWTCACLLLCAEPARRRPRDGPAPLRPSPPRRTGPEERA